MNTNVEGKRLVYPGGSVPAQFVASHDNDAQKGFTLLCPTELPVPDGADIGAELNRQAEFAMYRTWSKDAHGVNSTWETDDPARIGAPLEGVPGVDRYWSVHARAGTLGHELPPEEVYDFWVPKGTERNHHPYGACYQNRTETISTGLREWYWYNDVQVVLLGGLALEYCVATTAKQLRALGFTVILNLAASPALNPADGKHAVAELKALGVIMIDSAAELRLEDIAQTIELE